MTLRAVIAGATGLIGSNLAEHLVSKGWEVYGIARKPQTGIPGVRPVAADLLEPEASGPAGRRRPQPRFLHDLGPPDERGGEYRGQRRPGAEPACRSRRSKPSSTSPSSPA